MRNYVAMCPMVRERMRTKVFSVEGEIKKVGWGGVERVERGWE